MESDSSPKLPSYLKQPSQLTIRGGIRKRLKQIPFSKDLIETDVATFYRDDSTHRDLMRTLQNSEFNSALSAGRSQQGDSGQKKNHDYYRASNNNSMLHPPRYQSKFQLISPMHNGLPVLPNGVHIVQNYPMNTPQSNKNLNRNSTLNFDF